MRRIAVVMCLLISSVAYAGDAQWWNCRYSFKGKTKKGSICTSDSQYQISMRFCREVVPDSWFSACEQAATNAIGGSFWGSPVCRATHSSCVE